MAAPVPIPDLNFNAGRDIKLGPSSQADSRASSAGTISPVTIGGLLANNNWLMLGLIAAVTITGIVIFKGKK